MLAGLPDSAWCQIYVGAEPGQGAIVLSNFPSSQAPVLLVASPLEAAAAPSNAAARARAVAPTAELRQMIDSVAGQNDLPPTLLHAVIEVESRYNASAVSNKGAIGLMQVLPSTGKRFGATDLFSPRENVSAGAQYLKWLMQVFDRDLELVLAAYNAGEQAVIRAGGKIPPFPETQAYVRKVLSALRQAPTPAS